jgi:putative transposase
MSTYNPEIHHRKSTRLHGYDYSRTGYYFVTINLDNIRCMLAVWNNGRLQLSPIGEIAQKYWMEIPIHYPNVGIDEFVVMPEHFHGILIIRDNNDCDNERDDSETVWVRNIVGVQNFEPLPQQSQNKPSTNCYGFQHILPDSLGSIIRAYKSAVTMWCRKNAFPQFKWQRNYFDHIIRDENALHKIRSYIRNNPAALMDCFPGLGGF